MAANDEPSTRPTRPVDPSAGAAAVALAPAAMPSLSTGMWRGARGLCPVCGEGKLFRGYLSLVTRCSHCGTPLGRLRADDAPPYFVIFLVGHLLVPLVFMVERAYEPPMWVHMAVWLPSFAVACVLLLRPVKGATAAWMLRVGLHGDADDDDDRNDGRPRRDG